MKKSRQRLPGHIRREEIIKAALKVMAKQGYPKFTMRNVAENAGIHFATLQYYFRNKNALLRALFNFKLEEDSRLFHAAIENGGQSNEQRFSAAIKVILQADRDPIVIGYFLQLWALGCHDKLAAKNLDHYYDAYLNWIKELILIVNEGLAEDAVQMRARTILALLEGLVPAYTRVAKNRKVNKEYDQHLLNTIYQIATGQDKKL